jgi:recombination protein RecR
MVDKIPPLDRLLKMLQRVPYLASKNVYRVASYFLKMDAAQLQAFCDQIIQARELLTRCLRCCCWQEKDGVCFLCTAPNRDKGLVCVVETWQELMFIERTQGYNGVYHVLNGVIAPLEGIGPDDLTITQLIERVHEGGVQEIIFAMSQTPEGEATAAYIAHKLKPYAVKITCLARGLPVGSTLEATDRVTIFKAITERRLF